MTEKELKQYRPMKNEIQDLERRMQEERERDIPAVCGKVKGSMKEFPYIEERISVEMNEPVERDKSRKRIEKWQKRKAELEERVAEIEAFIEDIADSDTCRIFRLWVYDGKRQKEIAEIVGYDRSVISKKIKRYL